MRRILPAITIVTLLSVSACSSGAPAPAATPAAASSAPAFSTSIPARDENAATACRLLDEAQNGDKLMDDGVVLEVTATARKAGSDDFHAAADALDDAYRNAVLAKGTDDEFSTSARLLTAATEMSTLCIKARYA